MSTKRRSKGTQNSVTPPPPATAEASAETASMEASAAPKKRTRKSVTPPPGEVKPRTRRSKRPVTGAGSEAEATLFDGITPTPPPPVDLMETPAPTPAIEAIVEAVPVAEPPPPPVVAKPEKRVEKKQDVAAAKTTSREDEISVPPVSSDLDDVFFESKSPPPSARVPMELEPTRDLRMEQLTSPAAHARRAQLAKYVKAVVGVSLVVCFLAFVRIAIQRNHSTPETSAMAATSPPAQNTPPPSPATKLENAPEQPAQAAPQPADTPPPAAAPEAAESHAGLGPVPNPEPAASAPANPDEPVNPDPAEAKKEKHKSHIALEQGKTDESITHGELAVKLDPTDGESWLILGAAYQSKGNWTDARRCYRSCLSEGKRGPRGECSAMLR